MAVKVGVILRQTPQLQVLLVKTPSALWPSFPHLAKNFKGAFGRRDLHPWAKLSLVHRQAQARQPYLAVLPRQFSAKKIAACLKNIFDPSTLAQGFWQPLAKVPQLAAPDGAVLNEALGRLWPILPQGLGSRQWRACLALPPWMLKNKLYASDDIIFFGGSFNPWHHGHQACVDLCQQRFPQAKIVIVPDHNPWKKFAPQVCYWALYQDLAKKLKNTPYLIYPGFYGHEKEHPTAHWLLACACHKKSFLMGDDNLMSFLSWHQAADLLRGLDRLIIVPRTADPAARAKQMALLTKYNPRLKLAVLPEHPYEKLSSTKMRH